MPDTTPQRLDHALHRPDRPDVPRVLVPDGVQPFRLAGRPVRGRLVRLGPLADALLTRHDNPSPVTRLLGEALALTAALAGALKFQGSFSLQAKGDGQVSMLLADCTDSGELRGYARVAEGASGDGTAGALLGTGYLAFTCDQGPEQDRYQGIVSIEGATLADMTAHYFRTSEQLRAQLHLACAATPHGWRAAALVLERVATAGGHGQELDEAGQEDAWRTALALSGTLTEDELLDDGLPSAVLLHRLFHADGLEIDAPRPLGFGCRCSRARLAEILARFPEDDLDHMADTGAIRMNCEFCNLAFQFDRGEMAGAAA